MAGYRSKPRLGRNFTHDLAANKTYGLYGIASHSYGSAAVDWTLSEDEAEASLLLVTAASGVANAVLSSVKPGKTYILNNAAGYAITLKVSGGSGIAVANAKIATLVCNATDIVRVTADT